MKRLTSACMMLLALCTGLYASGGADVSSFSAEEDLLSLHYDHAPGRDDGHSAAADRTILQSMFGVEWIKEHALAVSGVYGKNAEGFNPESDLVMDAVWGSCGGWLAGHTTYEHVVAKLTTRWSAILFSGGDVWVKEGGQSDLTAEVVRRINKQWPGIDTAERVHVVQHSDWNENQTTGAALEYARQHTDYIRIRDANDYLNVKGGDHAFVRDAIEHPVFGMAWKAAFAYYDPAIRLDFSDTGELMYILGLGEMGIEEFRKRYLSLASEQANTFRRLR